MIENIEKIFFIPGDLVTIKHDLPNKPIMLVKGKETKTIRGADSTHFVGIKCFWFTTEGLYQESIYNTKDLEKAGNYKSPYSISDGFVHTPAYPIGICSGVTYTTTNATAK